MREEFLEPLPDLQVNAKLMMGKTTIPCVIIEVTADGFRVAVPGAEQYEGDPKITLVTHGANYPVRLVLQEPHVGGYSYRLQRIEQNLVSDGRTRPSDRFRLVTSKCCAVGLIGLVAAGYHCLPKSNELLTLLNRRSLRHESIGTWSPSIAENDRIPPGISVDKSLRSDALVGDEAGQFESEMPAVSVSMIHSASMTSTNRSIANRDERPQSAKRGPSHESSSASTVQNRRRDVSLKSLLEDGQTGRVQPANRELLSWLNRSAPSDEQVAFRLSDAARFDLQQFEIGLKELSNDSSNQAISSLRRAMLLASSDVRSPCSISGSPHVFVVASDDANIYFRKAHGQIELVRVLPIGLSQGARQ